MQCEKCNERQAAVHLTQVVDNSITTLHLCKVCAEEQGVQTGAALSKFPLSDLLASMGKESPQEVSEQETAARCPACGATLQDFRETGRLGCPVCYDTFAPRLRDLLRRLHGSSQHVGQRYARRALPTSPAGLRLSDLREQLRRAVDSEHFELAAEIRDQIRVLE